MLFASSLSASVFVSWQGRGRAAVETSVVGHRKWTIPADLRMFGVSGREDGLMEKLGAFRCGLALAGKGRG